MEAASFGVAQQSQRYSREPDGRYRHAIKKTAIADGFLK